ncbi:hypothetical protein DNU06_01940 [Putridiphycobacter roseus]|uniref:Uncharacterized protein n=1 Tax=Putridiphycobacter roseus TaxID=2219161 RepID=A0A2W1NL95_9FLAO|nr:FecR family protein [Putridiphycobacter roseus]PZE18616.1 hypothetical protein DNU06_01940 [Putridiphycobacter roseus]
MMSIDKNITDALLMAYHNNELDDKNKRAVKAWINESTSNKDIYLDLVKVWERSAELKPAPVAVDTDMAWKNVINKIDVSSKRGLNIRLKPILQIAAVFALLLTSFLVWKSTQKSDSILYAGIEKTNTVLSDGSKITMNVNSKITVDKHFEKDSRTISLAGEAFFDVKRDTSAPFIIHMPDQTFVKVLGTSFNINNTENETSVYVQSGKVEFGTAKTSIFLTKGQQAIYDHNTKTITQLTAEKNESAAVYWMDEKLNFEGETLQEILVTLETIFHSKIELHCEKAKNYAIVSSHYAETLTEILTVICTVHQLKMEIIDGEEPLYILKCDE